MIGATNPKGGGTYVNGYHSVFPSDLRRSIGLTLKARASSYNVITVGFLWPHSDTASLFPSAPRPIPASVRSSGAAERSFCRPICAYLFVTPDGLSVLFSLTSIWSKQHIRSFDAQLLSQSEHDVQALPATSQRRAYICVDWRQISPGSP